MLIQSTIIDIAASLTSVLLMVIVLRINIAFHSFCTFYNNQDSLLSDCYNAGSNLHYCTVLQFINNLAILHGRMSYEDSSTNR